MKSKHSKFKSMAITNNNQRGLVIVSNLATHGDRKFKDLYRFLESSGISMAVSTIGQMYGTVRRLSGARASLENFVDTIKEVTDVSTIKEVDVILHLHGKPNKLFFAEGEKEIGVIEQSIKNLNRDSKLRMLYSTACFGSSHGDNFVRAGFTCASGSKAVNANSPIEYPVFLAMWASGKRFSECINTAENNIGSIPFDAIARMALGDRFEVNSDKNIFGSGSTTIRST